MNFMIDSDQNYLSAAQNIASQPECSESATVRISDLAKKFRVCNKTIGRHVDEGLLPPPDFYVGRFPHWKSANIERWIETKKRV
jgi:predicted DNA-binding transcriptional regulator AlpA